MDQEIEISQGVIDHAPKAARRLLSANSTIEPIEDGAGTTLAWISTKQDALYPMAEITLDGTVFYIGIKK